MRGLTFRLSRRFYATPWVVVVLAALVLAAPVAMRNATLARTPDQAPLRHGAMLPGAAAVEGRARVLDGDTIEIASTRIRLEGIDAPEGGQTCPRAGGGIWRCGQEAAAELQKLIGRASVRCESRGTDTYGRTLGICFVGATDINAEMIRRGFAWAFVKYSRTYVTEEADARKRGIGIWQAPTTTAWDYRAGRWSTADNAIPGDCPIKGNITSNGRIYHMPWSPWYEKVRIDEGKGERWFCTEREALAAGWRPANIN
jgi:endonuclease YncB( thermonuclease family)